MHKQILNDILENCFSRCVAIKSLASDLEALSFVLDDDTDAVEAFVIYSSHSSNQFKFISNNKAVKYLEGLLNNYPSKQEIYNKFILFIDGAQYGVS